MVNQKSVMVIAGEHSGDQIAAEMIRGFDQNVLWFGMGGRAMQQAGVVLDVDYRDYAVMGFFDVLLKLFAIIKLKKQLKLLLREKNPRCLVCIDYPGLNLIIGEEAKKLGIPVIYSVAPKVWASREKRLSKIRETVDHLFCILPFEVAYFAQHGIKAQYVGHPLLESIPANDPVGRGTIKVLALMPGSRYSEIKRIAPLLCDFACELIKEYPDLTFKIPVASEQDESWLRELFAPLMAGALVDFMPGNGDFSQVDYAVVASGTATLELAKRLIPMMVVYRLDSLSYFIAKRIIKVPYVSLCNLIADKAIVPELLQDEANVTRMMAEFSSMMSDRKVYQHMVSNLKEVLIKVGHYQPAPLYSALQCYLT